MLKKPLTLKTLEGTVRTENVGCSWRRLQNPAEDGGVPRQRLPLKDRGALQSYCISEWLKWCLKPVSKARWCSLSLFSHLLLFDRQAAALNTFYNLQTVPHLKNTWFCLDASQIRVGGRGWEQRPFIPNRILIHGSSCTGLGLPPQNVNCSLCVIKSVVLTLLNHFSWASLRDVGPQLPFSHRPTA